MIDDGLFHSMRAHMKYVSLYQDTPEMTSRVRLEGGIPQHQINGERRPSTKCLHLPKSIALRGSLGRSLCLGREVHRISGCVMLHLVRSVIDEQRRLWQRLPHPTRVSTSCGGAAREAGMEKDCGGEL